MKKVLEENETLKQIVNDAGRPSAHLDGFHQYISQIFFEKSS